MVSMMRKAAFVLASACAINLANSHSAFAQAGDAKKGIEAGNKAFGAAIAAGNAAGVAALYTDDAVAMPPNGEAVTGRPAIEKAFQGMIASGVKEVVLTAKEVEAHGDTATEVGAYSVKDAAGKELDRGKYIVVWKRVQGQWKLHRDIWNSNVPMPPAK
jgi:uncharacterized protein (TIGR02246 family)